MPSVARVFVCESSGGRLLPVCMFLEDYEWLKGVLGVDLYGDPVPVRCTADYSRRGRLKAADCHPGTGDSIEFYEAASRSAREARRLLSDATRTAPTRVAAEPRVETYAGRVVVYVATTRLVTLLQRQRYTAAYTPEKLPPQVESALVAVLSRWGFRRGEYGGMIRKPPLSGEELRQLTTELLVAAEKYADTVAAETARREAEEIRRARSLLLWVDDWDPSKPLHLDAAEKLGVQQRPRQAAQALEPA